MQSAINYNELGAQLTLRVSDIRPFVYLGGIDSYSAIYQNEVGKVTGYGSDVTWFIDFEAVVGPGWYRQYDEFHVTMTEFKSIPYSVHDQDPLDEPMNNIDNKEYRLLNVWLSGDNVSFRQSSYDVPSQTSTRFAHLGTVGGDQTRTTLSGGVATGQNGNWRGDEYVYYRMSTFPNRDIIVRKAKRMNWRITFGGMTTNQTSIPSAPFVNPIINAMQYFIVKFNIVPFSKNTHAKCLP